jgi:hypothetical protein
MAPHPRKSAACAASCSPPLLMVYTAAALTLRNSKVATFNKVFSTRRLLQIIVVLGATVILKLLR